MEILLSLIFFGLAGGIIVPFLIAILFVMAGLFGSDK
jgi:hypothetical protein